MAASLGIRRADWCQMTPVELNLYARADKERLEQMQSLTQVNLYSLASMIRPMVWSKHPPSYEKLYPKQAQEEMSDDQLYAQVRALNKLFGGEEG